MYIVSQLTLTFQPLTVIDVNLAEKYIKNGFVNAGCKNAF